MLLTYLQMDNLTFLFIFLYFIHFLSILGVKVQIPSQILNKCEEKVIFL